MIEKQSSTLKFLTMVLVLLCFERTHFEIDFESTVISVNKMLCVGVNNGCSSSITQESRGLSSVVRDMHSNFDSSMDNQLTTSNGNNHPEKHPLSMHEEVCNNKKSYLLCNKNSAVLNIK